MTSHSPVPPPACTGTPAHQVLLRAIAEQYAAAPVLQARLATTLTRDDLLSLQRAFLSLLDVLEQDLDALSAGQARLTEAQRTILARLRARQTALDLSTDS